jgi:hypothetical protein
MHIRRRPANECNSCNILKSTTSLHARCLQTGNKCQTQRTSKFCQRHSGVTVLLILRGHDGKVCHLGQGEQRSPVIEHLVFGDAVLGGHSSPVNCSWLAHSDNLEFGWQRRCILRVDAASLSCAHHNARHWHGHGRSYLLVPSTTRAECSKLRFRLNPGGDEHSAGLTNFRFLGNNFPVSKEAAACWLLLLTAGGRDPLFPCFPIDGATARITREEFTEAGGHGCQQRCAANELCLPAFCHESRRLLTGVTHPTVARHGHALHTNKQWHGSITDTLH